MYYTDVAYKTKFGYLMFNIRFCDLYLTRLFRGVFVKSPSQLSDLSINVNDKSRVWDIMNFALISLTITSADTQITDGCYMFKSYEIEQRLYVFIYVKLCN